MNPYPAHLMSPAERRAELCRLPAIGLVRLQLRDIVQDTAGYGEFPLHSRARQSGHATPTHRRNA